MEDEIEFQMKRLFCACFGFPEDRPSTSTAAGGSTASIKNFSPKVSITTPPPLFMAFAASGFGSKLMELIEMAGMQQDMLEFQKALNETVSNYLGGKD